MRFIYETNVKDWKFIYDTNAEDSTELKTNNEEQIQSNPIQWKWA